MKEKKNCKHLKAGISLAKLSGRLAEKENKSEEFLDSLLCLICLEPPKDLSHHLRTNPSHFLFLRPSNNALWCQDCNVERRGPEADQACAMIREHVIKVKQNIVVVKKADKDEISIKGLKNFGNTCYLNALLQFLSDVTLPFKDDKFNLFNEVLDGLRLGSRNVSTKPLLKLIENEFDFRIGEQQDSHELLRLLFNHCHEKSIYDLFGLEIEQRLSCNCRDVNAENALELSIWLEDKALMALITENDLADKLDALQISDKVDCLQCKTETTLHRMIKEIKGDWLIVRLMRFKRGKKDGWDKDGRRVSLRPAIRLAQFNWQLSALIEHQGQSMDSGHYIALVRRQNTWYYASDEQIRRLPQPPPLQSTQAYLLLYRKDPCNALE